MTKILGLNPWVIGYNLKPWLYPLKRTCTKKRKMENIWYIRDKTITIRIWDVSLELEFSVPTLKVTNINEIRRKNTRSERTNYINLKQMLDLANIIKINNNTWQKTIKLVRKEVDIRTDETRSDYLQIT